MTQHSTTHSWLRQNPKVTAFIVAGIGCLAAAPIYFYGFFPTSSSTDHGKTATAAEFGTAFNGIVGTAFTILGLTFLLYAYLDQLRQAELTLFNKLYDDLIEYINSVQYRKHTRRTLFKPASSELFQGVDALYNYDDDSPTNPSAVLNNINLIIVSFEQIIAHINKSEHQELRFKQIMRSKIYFLYLSKIFWPCYHIYTNQRRQLMRREWGNTRMMFYKYERLTLEAYRYLRENKLISDGNYNSDLSYMLNQPGINAGSWEDRWRKEDMAPTSRLESFLIELLGEGYQVDRVMNQLDSRPFMLIRQVIANMRKS